jgi:hypothetical protein
MSERYSLEDTIYDLPGEGLHISPPAEQTCYDLRTPQQQAADDIAALRLEVVQLRDVVEYLARRLERLERGNGND